MIIFKNKLSAFDLIIYRRIYLTIFLSFLLITRVVPISSILNESVNLVLAILFSLFGLFYIMLYLLKYNFLLFKRVDNILLSLFIVICIISSVMNIKYGYIDNLKMIVWMIIQFFVLYMRPLNSDKESIINDIKMISIIPVAITTIACMISIWQFAFQISYKIELADYPRWQGFHEFRLFGIFDDPNYAAIACLVSLLLIINYITKVKKRSVKAVLYMCGLVNLIYILLSGSRTGELSLLSVIAITSFIYTRDKLSKLKKSFYAKFIPFIVMVLLTCSFYLLIDVFKAKVIVFPEFITNIFQQTETEEVQEQPKNGVIPPVENIPPATIVPPATAVSDQKPENENVSLQRETENDFTNNRLDIWINVLRITQNERIIGVSPRNLIPFAKENYPYNYIAVNSYETHNGYLAVLACTGVIGSIIIIIFILYNLRNTIKYIFGSRGISVHYLIPLSIVVSIALSAITLLDIFFMNTYTAGMFWLFLGILNNYHKCVNYERSVVD